jgi:hypothetical protein
MTNHDMGLGKLGSTHIQFINKFRWTFEADFDDIKVAPIYTKIKSRPINAEKELDFIKSIDFVPGPKEPETITTTFYGVSTDTENDKLANFYEIIKKCFDFTDPTVKKAACLGTIKLSLFDGVGCLLESWTLTEAWPKSLTFGDLSDDDVIEVIWAYNGCKYESAYKYTPANPIDKDKPIS